MKESAWHCRRCKRLRFDPWVRIIPWSRKWQPTPVFLPGESHGQRSLEGYSSWNHTICRDTTEQAQMDSIKPETELVISLLPTVTINWEVSWAWVFLVDSWDGPEFSVKHSSTWSKGRTSAETEKPIVWYDLSGFVVFSLLHGSSADGMEDCTWKILFHFVLLKIFSCLKIILENALYTAKN